MDRFHSFTLTVFCLFLAAFPASFSQNFIPVCAYSRPDSTAGSNYGFRKLTFNPSIQRSGRWIPTSTGGYAFKVLVVFMRFPSDTEATTTWAVPDSLPVAFSDIISPTLDTSSYTGHRLTNYYWENSYHKMRVVGDVKYITLNHNEEYYSSIDTSAAICRGNIVREALIELDSTVNFKDYDNWDNRTEFTQIHQPDSVVDNIWFILRNFRRPAVGTDFTFEGTSANIEIANESSWMIRFETRDTVNVFAGNKDQKDSLRSGIILFGSYAKVPVTMKDHNGPTLYGTIAHELSHPIFGPGHVVNDFHYGYNGENIYDCMTGYAINSSNGFGSHLGYEKWRAGWLEASRVRTVSLNDTCVRVQLADIDKFTPGAGVNLIEVETGSNQRILVEYRGTNGFDSDYAPYNQPHARMGDGVLMYNLVNEREPIADSHINTLRADGHYDWKLVLDGQLADTVVYGTGSGHLRCDQRYDIIDRLKGNPYNGFGDRHTLFIKTSNGAFMKEPDNWWTRPWYTHFHPAADTMPPARGPYTSATNFLDYNTDCNDNSGDVDDLFQVGAVLSPYTNPPTRLWVGGSTGFDTAWVAIRVVSYDSTNKSYTIEVRRDSLWALPPAPPQSPPTHPLSRIMWRSARSPNRTLRTNSPDAHCSSPEWLLPIWDFRSPDMRTYCSAPARISLHKTVSFSMNWSRTSTATSSSRTAASRCSPTMRASTTCTPCA